ncbi:hypothetical protein TNCV_1952201 [Trichonephila clavipes]|nr:hypothetical protein TNCV_1952201 [Trichonephila clavipes]
MYMAWRKKRLSTPELPCSKLTVKRPCNNDALNEMNKLGNLSNDNKNPHGLFLKVSLTSYVAILFNFSSNLQKHPYGHQLSKNVTYRVTKSPTWSPSRQHGHQVTKMVTNMVTVTKMVAKNDAIGALSPTFRQVSIESKFNVRNEVACEYFNFSLK